MKGTKRKSKQQPKIEPHNFTVDGKVLMLKRINKDGTSHGGHRWPESGTWEEKNWNPEPKCGGGIHAWPWGLFIGDGSDYDIINDIWVIISSDPADVVGNVDGGTKCKARKAEVVYRGNFLEAMNRLYDGKQKLIEAMAKQQEGYSAGHSSSSSSAGHSSRSSSAGHSSRSSSAGYSSRSSSAGHSSSSSSAGDFSTVECTGQNTLAAIAGIGGKVKVEDGSFAIGWEDANGKSRFLVGTVGENGIKSNTWYCVRNGQLMEVQQ